jgi:hypothetical protein
MRESDKSPGGGISTVCHNKRHGNSNDRQEVLVTQSYPRDQRDATLGNTDWRHSLLQDRDKGTLIHEPVKKVEDGAPVPVDFLDERHKIIMGWMPGKISRLHS